MYSTHNEGKSVAAEKFVKTYLNFGIENNGKDPKFKIGDHERISKFKNIFAKNYVPNWSEKVFLIKKS